MYIFSCLELDFNWIVFDSLQLIVWRVVINIQDEINSANGREEDGRSNDMKLEESTALYWIYGKEKHGRIKDDSSFSSEEG